jgi:hypothetical protein
VLSVHRRRKVCDQPAVAGFLHRLNPPDLILRAARVARRLGGWQKAVCQMVRDAAKAPLLTMRDRGYFA